MLPYTLNIYFLMVFVKAKQIYQIELFCQCSLARESFLSFFKILKIEPVDVKTFTDGVLLLI